MQEAGKKLNKSRAVTETVVEIRRRRRLIQSGKLRDVSVINQAIAKAKKGGGLGCADEAEACKGHKVQREFSHLDVLGG
jgi:hypothetical protein